MNIFFLHRNPVVAASQLCDQHVTKMALESCQLLSTWLWVKYGYADCVTMKPCYEHHPSQKWLHQSDGNVKWLVVHLRAMVEEKLYRTGKFTPSIPRYRGIAVITENFIRSNKGLTDPILAMPDEFKNYSPVQSYRKYYESKQLTFARPMRYTKRNPPEWMEMQPRTLIR